MGSWSDFQLHFRRFRSYELTFMPVPYLSVNLKILDIIRSQVTVTAIRSHPIETF